MKFISKTKKLATHVGFWSAVSGFVVVNFLYNGLLKEKTSNDHFEA
tara:strand:- start:33049 stop:33186 length:138 start_codon:yes stop_codon:yes gene_type:complete